MTRIVPFIAQYHNKKNDAAPAPQYWCTTSFKLTRWRPYFTFTQFSESETSGAKCPTNGRIRNYSRSLLPVCIKFSIVQYLLKKALQLIYYGCPLPSPGMEIHKNWLIFFNSAHSAKKITCGDFMPQRVGSAVWFCETFCEKICAEGKKIRKFGSYRKWFKCRREITKKSKRGMGAMFLRCHFAPQAELASLVWGASNQFLSWIEILCIAGGQARQRFDS
jgi:hypothetical protein